MSCPARAGRLKQFRVQRRPQRFLEYMKKSNAEENESTNREPDITFVLIADVFWCRVRRCSNCTC